ncbi:hypothetical protein [Paratractidigestivibacter faecalis]|uniref:Uncharacterized protein n=1 Tax=Paratractidigestivibacter faecalis TaxID=2292441 RepID=A0ABV1IDR3_9ACTN
MISDEKRREVAARMREIMRDDPHGWLDAMVVNAAVDVPVSPEGLIADWGFCPHCGMGVVPNE